MAHRPGTQEIPRVWTASREIDGPNARIDPPTPHAGCRVPETRRWNAAGSTGERSRCRTTSSKPWNRSSALRAAQTSVRGRERLPVEGDPAIREPPSARPECTLRASPAPKRAGRPDGIQAGTVCCGRVIVFDAESLLAGRDDTDQRRFDYILPNGRDVDSHSNRFLVPLRLPENRECVLREPVIGDKNR